jgi:hypothetical protein
LSYNILPLGAVIVASWNLNSKLANEAITFVLVDAENAPESRKLANVSNLPTFATLLMGTGKMKLKPINKRY